MSDAPLPDDLPPVRPPSAVFVLQLFVVPGLIVAVIVGVWLLFGHMASSEQDWRALMTELKHPNELRRWRAAHGLAQMLQADEKQGATGQHLAQNGLIAADLAGELTREIQRGGKTDADLKYQAFLARTLGMFDTTTAVLPALELAIQIPHEQESDVLRVQKLEVRKNALASVGVMADRLEKHGQPLDSTELTNVVLEVSHHEDRLLRQVAAYTLGLLRGTEADTRLTELLDDADPHVQTNAAIGLARKHDTRGYRVLKEVLGPGSATSKSTARTHEEQMQEQNRRFEQLLSMKNALTALNLISVDLTTTQREEARAPVKPLSDSFEDLTIRHAAADTLRGLEK